MKKKIIIVVLAVLLAIATRFIMSAAGSYMKKNSAKNRPAPNVVVDTISEQDVIQSFDAPGRVVSKYQVSVMARISGYLQKSLASNDGYIRVVVHLSENTMLEKGKGTKSDPYVVR